MPVPARDVDGDLAGLWRRLDEWRHEVLGKVVEHVDWSPMRELDLETTGHAQRGVSSTPSPGPSNLHMAAGDKSPGELIADIADGFYVTDMIGMGVNLVTGDYSRGASGFWIENGERTYPVSEVTIAGHLSEMFASLVPANDLVFRYGTNAPTLRVEGMTVAGQ